MHLFNKPLFHKSLFHVAAIIFLVLLVYSNTLDAPFQFDDYDNIVHNPAIKDLRYFTGTRASGFQSFDALTSRFIGYLSFVLNYYLHGLDLTGYHIVNLVIHIINALLVYWLVILTFSTPYFANRQNSAHQHGDHSLPANLMALFSALLFASHPIQTQAVTYIVQRFASLATLFYLLSLVSYIKWRISFFQALNSGPGSRKLKPASFLIYLASVLSAVLAMKTKEIAFTLPIIITLYEFMFFEGTIKKRVLWLTPLILTVLIIPLSLISVDKPLGEIINDMSEGTRLQSPLSRWDYLFTQFRVIVTYIRLIFLPVNQNIDYDYPAYHSFFDAEVFLSFLFLLSVAGLAIFLLCRSRLAPSASRLAAFGIFWFFITLSVESSVIPIADVIYEHRVYLPSIGFFTALISAIGTAGEKWGSMAEYTVKVAVSIMLTVVLALSATAYVRNDYWRDGIRLWIKAVEASPDKARSHFNLGLAYLDKRRFDEAIKEFQIVLKQLPDFAKAHNNLGLIYIDQGRTDDAIKEFQAVLKINPNDPMAPKFIELLQKKKLIQTQ